METLLNSNIAGVWEYFFRISSVPRPSKKEDKIREELIAIATENQWTFKIDKAGNIVLYTKPTDENTPIIIQNHMA